jgi:hypothetical protein
MKPRAPVGLSNERKAMKSAVAPAATMMPPNKRTRTIMC